MAMPASIETVSGYRFEPAQLAAGRRQPGLSAFMRVRNGEEFLERTVLSHLPFFDEIVIVFNQCTDGTEAVVARLAARHPDRIRAYHYLDRVHPPGHRAYLDLPQDSTASMGTYSNFALTRTTRSVVAKLDDDHVCIERNFEPLVRSIRERGYRLGGRMLCFSGLNLVREDGVLKVLASEPFCGTGDIGFFEVSEHTRFAHGTKHETFSRRGLARVYAGLVFLHCKYLKRSFGFANYELEDNPGGRFERKLHRFMDNRAGLELDAFRARYRWPGRLATLAPRLPGKPGLVLARALSVHRDLEGLDLERAMERAAACAPA